MTQEQKAMSQELEAIITELTSINYDIYDLEQYGQYSEEKETKRDEFQTKCHELRKEIMTSMCAIHTLTNGATVTSLSPHGFRFDDGTSSSPQNSEIVDMFTLKREFKSVKEINGMQINQMKMVMTYDQRRKLKLISSIVDIVIVPFPVLVSLREAGIREDFPNCLSFNCTKETMRESPQNKVIDTNNWSY